MVVVAVAATRFRTDGNSDGGGRLGGLERVASTDTRTDGDEDSSCSEHLSSMIISVVIRNANCNP